jgi:hypothetical protein
MTYLPSLATKIESFYKLTGAYDLVAQAALGDDKIYNQLLAAANTVDVEAGRRDVAQQIKMLAAMFHKATEMGAGFQTILMATKGILEDLESELEEDDPGKNEVDEALHSVLQAVRTRATERDNPTVQRELQRAAGDALRQMEESGEEIERPEEAQENLLEMGQSSEAAGARGSEPGRAATPEENAEANEVVQLFEEEAGAKMDPTAGLTPEMREKGPGAGVQLFEKRPYKDWADVYSRERNKFDTDLNAPANQVTASVAEARKQTKVRYYLFTLTKTLSRLIELTQRAEEISHVIALETEVKHEAEEKELADIQQKMRGLERLRNNLKQGLYFLYRETKLRDMREDFDTTQDPRRKVILSKKIMRAQEVLKKNEEKRDRFENSKRDLFKQRAADQASRMGYGLTPGKSRESQYRQYEWSKMTLDGLLVQLGHSIADKRQTLKKKLIPALENFGLQQAKEYADDIATAAVKQENIGGAVHRLSQQARDVIKQKMKEQKQVLFPKQMLMTFLFATRIIKEIVEWRNSVEALDKVLSGKPKLRRGQKKEEAPPAHPIPLGQVPVDVLFLMQKAAQQGRALSEKYSAYQAKIPEAFVGGPSEKSQELGKQRYPVYMGREPTEMREKVSTIVDRMNFICNYLEGRLQEEKRLQGLPEEA